MDPERALTVAIVAFVAGSTTAMLVLTVVGSLTDGADALRFGLGAVSGVAAAVGVGLADHRNADEGQLTGR